ncbi:hypothetical protein KAR91_01745 [Candidatus Pacearchaeota archaeon]|nr:hypothetical protein [Candidatus Pacearchaeota archaeon]
MTRSERDNLKQEAQCQLFFGMQVSFMRQEGLEEEDGALLLGEMDKQMKRIERLFGWEVGSWKRGC